MALPTLNDVHAVDPVLQGMLVGYAQAETRFAALDAFPAIPSDKSGTYYSFDKKYWFLDGLEERAPGGEFAKGGFGVSTATYDTIQFAKSYVLPDEINSARQFNLSLEQVGVRWLAQQSFIRKERAFSADFMTTGVWGTDNTGATDWDDSSGVPVTDCLTARRTVSQATGYTPNSIIMGEIVYDALLVNAQIKTLLQYTQTMTVETVKGLLAAVLGFDTLLVSRAIYNSANEGQSASMSPVMDDDALVFYNDPMAGEFGATAGKTFVWNEGGGAGSQNSYMDESRDATVIKHKEQWDQKVVAADLGYFFSDIV